MKLSLPQYINDIICIFENKGYKIYCVGGCVRDLLLGLVPADYDLASDCPAEKVTELFERVYPTGIRHGTVTIVYENQSVEVTKFRIDGEYENNRRPANVQSASNILEDLSRRDFTVNAIAYNPSEGILDPFAGEKDIKSGIIRCVGEAQKRFQEDALRIMRAFRFCAQLGFSLDESTSKAAVESSRLLQNISRERIFSELIKLISSAHPHKADLLFESGALRFMGIVNPKSLKAMEKLPGVREIRFAAFCYLCGISPEILGKALKADGKLIKISKTVYDMLFELRPETPAQIKRLFARIQPEYLEHYLTARELLLSEDTGKCRDILKEAVSGAQPWKLSMLAVNGRDIAALGYSGEEIGNQLNRLLEYVIEYPNENRRENLLKISQK